jgi:hypothetical protein
VFGNVGLDEDRRFFRIDPGGEIDTGEIQCFLPENFWILWQRYRVEIYDAVKAFVFFLQGDPVFQSSKIISDVKLAGGLGTAENAFFHKLDRENVIQSESKRCED